MKKDSFYIFLKLFTLFLTFLFFKFVFLDYLKPSYETYRSGSISRAIFDDFLNDSLSAEIVIDDAITEKHDSLGSDLSYQYYFNGKPIKSGSVVKLSKNGNNTIKAVYTESDDAQDDVGSASVSFDGKAHSQTKKTKLKVVEQGGRKNKGAYLVWDITYTITPVAETSKVKTSVIGFVQTIDKKYSFIILALISWYIFLFKIIKKRKKAIENQKSSTSNNLNSSYVSRSKNDSIEKSAENVNATNIFKDKHNNNHIATSNDIRCPRCGQRMVKRRGRYGYFYGCCNYPYCKGTRNYNR